MKSGERWTVQIGDEETTAVYEAAEGGSAGVTYVQAHGAGGSMDDRSTAAAATTLRACGLDVVRFNFLYRAKGSSRPDQMPKLQACFAAVVDSVRKRLNLRTGRQDAGTARTKPQNRRQDAGITKVLIGGRSMGGRAASMMAAEGFVCDGLILLAYPLHPPGQPEKMRDAHLAQIRAPVLCFNGTRDDFCRRDLMDAVVAKLPPTWTMHWLAEADHSFRVRKSSSRTDADVLDEVARAVTQWLAASG
ncbi:MAG: alpha/beta hydrolase family protein [Candidatus Acidiferrales bacterium]